MSQATLKSLFGKRSEVSVWLQSLMHAMNMEICVEDDQHRVLFGTSTASLQTTEPVILAGEVVGWVKGERHAALVAQWLSIMIQKEAEKKKLGTEVLGMYQELNVIFNFSEKLAETIDPDVIAKLTLEQAMHSIPSHSGVIVLWNAESNQLMIPAASGEPLFNETVLRANAGLLLKIELSGNSEIMNDLTPLKKNDIINEEVQSVIYAAMKVKHRIMGAVILARRKAEQYTAAHLKLLVTLALQSSSAIESALLYEKNIREVREREEAILRIHEVTQKFVPHEFIHSLGKEVLTEVKLGDQVEKIVTVLFSDIRNYTTLSESMTPEENFSFVSSFNERMGPIIRKHNGFINQYLGDAIMAIFPDQPGDGLAAAVEMQHAVQEFNKERQLRHQASIQIGVGVHTGPLIMGITGDEKRMDATTISDTVNTASRLESLTKYYKASIILSDETLRQIDRSPDFRMRSLGKVQVKGKLAPVGIYECFSGNKESDVAKKEKTLTAFNEGLSAYLSKSFSDAIRAFSEVIAFHPEDLTAKFFIEKAIAYIEHGVPEEWAGVEEMIYK